MSGTTARDGTFDLIAKRLVHVGFAAAAVDETSRSLTEAVGQARDAGATWAQIAEVLGCSRKTASVRFARRAP